MLFVESLGRPTTGPLRSNRLVDDSEGKSPTGM